MSWVQLETDLTTWFIEGTFIASVIFTGIYGTMYYWRSTITGRFIFGLGCCIAGALLHSALLAWHLTYLTIAVRRGREAVHMDLFGDILTWVSIVSLAGAGLCLLGLTVRALWIAIADEPENLTRFGRRVLCRH